LRHDPHPLLQAADADLRESPSPACGRGCRASTALGAGCAAGEGRFKLALLVLLLFVACRRDMVDRPEKRPLGSSAFFDDRTASRPLVADVVPRVIPQRVVISVARGREQYNIYCQPCHGARGDGNGIIVQHGFPRPPDLRGENPNDVINAVTFGKGLMYSIPDADAQSIALYVQTFRRQ